MATATKTPTWVTFAGTFLLLIGLFFSTRTLANMFLFQKYPTVASTSLAGFIGLDFFRSEESCSYPSVSGETTTDDNCIKTIKASRDSARITDVTNSLFFLFVGSGILYSRKRFFK